MISLTRRTFVMLLALAALLGVVGGGLVVSRGEPRGQSTQAAEAPVIPVQVPLQSNTFAKIAEAIRPAVININTYGKGFGRTPFEEFFGEEFFKRFFGEMPERIPQRSLGSGVIVDPSGIALTNAHVVERATEIEIITLDGRKHKAKVVGADKKTDLAVLKLDDGKGAFSYVRLGENTKLEVRKLPPDTELRLWKGSIYVTISDRLEEGLLVKTPAGDVDVDPATTVRIGKCFSRRPQK